MASSPLPQSQRSRHDVPTPSQAAPSEQVTVEAGSSATNDSSPVILDPPSTQTDSESGEASKAAADAATPSEPRKCWICQLDETEDTPTSSAWRTPCPCVMTAHEACLLDWVADLEARKKSRTIECPQCKTAIQIARPRHPVARAVRGATQLYGMAVVPGVFVTLAGTVWAGAFAHGVASLYLVFGPTDFWRLVRLAQDVGPWHRIGLRLVGVPLITASLISSQMSQQSRAVPALLILGYLPTLPAAADAPGLFGWTAGEPGLWPPSAALTFAVLPYAQVVYNTLMAYFFAERKLRWIRTVQPRADESEEQRAEAEAEAEAVEDRLQQQHHNHDHHHVHHHHHPDEDEEDEGADEEQAILEVDIGINMDPLDDDEDEAAPAPDVPQAVGAAAAAAAAEDQPAEADPRPGRPENRNGNGNGGAGLGGGRWILDTIRFADAVVGALVFPTIAAAAGQLLRLALPRAWTAPWTSLYGAGRPGLLQSQWGRSVVGGCLFVVVKDALGLYAV